MGTISANGEASLQIFEENLNIEKYTDILSNILDELRELSQSYRVIFKWIILKFNDCKRHYNSK